MPYLHRRVPTEGNNFGKGKVNRMRYLIAYITTKDALEARKIGEAVVNERIAACANIIPAIDSVYWWKGKLQKDKEAVLILKTKKSLAKKLIKRVKELHGYGVPCIDMIEIMDGNPDCFKWIEEVTK